MANKQNMASGVFLGESYVEWALLTRRKNRLETAERAQAPLEVNEETDRSSPEFASQFKSACGKLRKPVTAALPSDQVLLRVVDLPLVDPDELAGMVELQVDKFSPFPVENMIVSHEVLEKTDEYMRVLVAAVKRDTVDELGELFKKAGTPLTRIDVDTLAWWHHLTHKGQIVKDGRQVTLLYDMGGTELIVSEDGVPLVFRSLGSYYDMDPGQAAEELAEEVGYTLTSLEAEWGGKPTEYLELYHWGEEPEILTTVLRDECELKVETHSFEGMPTVSEGAAMRTPGEKESRIDLTPEEWHVTAANRRLRRKLFRATMVILFFWLCGLGSVIFLHRTAMAKVDALQAEVTQLKSDADTVKSLRGRIDELMTYGDPKYSALEYLRESSVYLPEGLDLSSFQFKRRKSITIRGTAPSKSPVYDFQKALEDSSLFVNVRADIKIKLIKGKRVTEFTITSDLPGSEKSKS